MRDYWDGRFKKEGKIWGDSPSSTAAHAIGLFAKDHVKTILVPGAGYGRNAKAFSDAGFAVTGIELSEEAVDLAKEYAPKVRFYPGSVLDMPFDDKVYDAIYCFNVLHLFRKADRAAFVDKCLSQLKDGGSLYFTVFSEKEPSYGKGAEVEPGTFESKPGRPVHYFTEEELHGQFNKCTVLGSGIVEDPENHGDEGPHTHVLHYIYAQKGYDGFDGERYKKASKHQKEWGDRMIAGLDLNGDEHILDMGCGDGTLTEKLAKLVPRGRVLGIDSSASMIRTAKKLEKGNLEFQLMNIEHIDFKEEFDLVFSNATLHWIKGHRTMLRKVFDSLKKGGFIRFNFGSKGNCSNFNEVAQEVISNEPFKKYFRGFEWPWYMPNVSSYEIMDGEPAFKGVIAWEENADRYFTEEELIGWLDQPTLIPFMQQVDDADKESFRELVIKKMLERTRQPDGRFFETFRRINVYACKD